MDTGALWGIATIVGPILLAAALLWAMLHNRGSKRDVQRTEDATRRMYDEQARTDAAREGR